MAGHVAHVKGITNAYRLLVAKLKGIVQYGRIRRR
jgi:hypothetical protein